MSATHTYAAGDAASPGWFARRIHAALKPILQGSLRLVDGNSDVTFGSGVPRATVTVHASRFYRRVAIGGTLGAGESYMDGDWECDDLVTLVRILLANRESLQSLDGRRTLGSQLASLVAHLGRPNSRHGSRRNVAAHYDLSNDFFQTFLDERMMYSSAVYEPGMASLEAASTAKLERLCRKLELGPGDHLLEIGSGWGSLAVYAAQQFGCRVTTVTLSPAQHVAAVARVQHAGLDDRVTVRLCDYRDLDGCYDKLVSVEMVEAVGHEYLEGYFGKLGRLLRPGGLMALQAITIEDHRYRQALRSVDFIKKHVFPGSFIPSVSRLVSAAAATTDTVLVNLEDIGHDYARTLSEWRRRTETHRDDIVALGFDERFLRMWRFYLAYCEGGFLERAISDVQLLFAKPGYRGRPWRAALDGADGAGR